MRSFIDQMGRTVKLDHVPKRIVSIVPSQTELLFDLGLREEVAGITKFCIHPEEMFRTRQHVGGTKNLNLDKIRELKPDLIIGNKEENERSQVETLMNEFPVWMSDILTLDDALEMIRSVGEITGKEQRAEELISDIRRGFKKIGHLADRGNHPRTAYFIWRKPYMVIGNKTFVNQMLKFCGFINVFEDLPRYPQITAEELREASPELILLSSEPYPFKEKHIAEFCAICPEAKIMVVDGELFSWYGSRLRFAPAYVEGILGRML